MKNKLFLMIMVVMVCSLTACGQQENGSMTNTGNSTEQVVTSEDNSELATAEDNNMEQTETKKQNQLQDVKPSYKEFRGVLDEIEAALDDVNVNRYAEYLKKFAKDTQFLVITHRKGTMEAADTVYGITMEENGISKLLSMKLK